MPEILTITLLIGALGVFGLGAEQKERRTQSKIMLVLALIILILFRPPGFNKVATNADPDLERVLSFKPPL